MTERRLIFGLALSLAALAATVIWLGVIAPKSCAPDTPRGETIGSVFKIRGC